MTRTRGTVLQRTLCCLALALAACANDNLLKLFAYNPSAPLDQQVVSSEKKEGYTLHQLTYASPKGGRVPAFLLIPDGRGPFPGVLLLHGMPSSAQGMLPEAERLARLGAISLAITAPFARSHRIGIQRGLNFDERDRDEQIQLIIDLRRGVDLLLSRPDVAKDRLGYVGISYGGGQGGEGTASGRPCLSGGRERAEEAALVRRRARLERRGRSRSPHLARRADRDPEGGALS
jgi:predicted dienelactone hydrolase